jgi:hypothetical protein
LRNWQVKNFLALTLLRASAPMLLVGDEARQTKNDNNKAYCHDDETKPRTRTITRLPLLLRANEFLIRVPVD